MADVTSPDKATREAATRALATFNAEITAKHRDISALETKIDAVKVKVQEVEQKKKELEDFRNTYKTIIGPTNAYGTRKRLNDIINIADKFDANKTISRQIYNL